MYSRFGHGCILAKYFFYPIKHFFTIMAKCISSNGIEFPSEIFCRSGHDVHNCEVLGWRRSDDIFRRYVCAIMPQYRIKSFER